MYAKIVDETKPLKLTSKIWLHLRSLNISVNLKKVNVLREENNYPILTETSLFVCWFDNLGWTLCNFVKPSRPVEWDLQMRWSFVL